MNITVQHNAREVGGFVRRVFQDQVPFATSQAINDSAKAAQAFQRVHQEKAFDLTPAGSRLFRLAVKIGPFASKRSLEARVAIEPPRGRRYPQDRSSIIARHESDRARVPFGGGMLAVPTDNVPRNGDGSIPRAWRPRQLLANGVDHGRSGLVTRGGITRFRRKSASGRINTGRRAAFLIRNKATGGGTIFERDGEELVPLYHLVPSVPLGQDLEFIDNVTKVVNRTYEEAFTRRFDQAMRTAR